MNLTIYPGLSFTPMNLWGPVFSPFTPITPVPPESDPEEARTQSIAKQIQEAKQVHDLALEQLESIKIQMNLAEKQKLDAQQTQLGEYAALEKIRGSIRSLQNDLDAVEKDLKLDNPLPSNENINEDVVRKKARQHKQYEKWTQIAIKMQVKCPVIKSDGKQCEGKGFGNHRVRLVGTEIKWICEGCNVTMWRKKRQPSAGKGVRGKEPVAKKNVPAVSKTSSFLPSLLPISLMSTSPASLASTNSTAVSRIMAFDEFSLESGQST